MPFISDFRNVARRVPGVRLAERGLGAVERVLLGELKQRLELVAGSTAADPVSTAPARGGRPGPQTLPERMEQLIKRSMDQTPTDSRRSVFEHALGELVPDEARILSALADGSRYPLVDISAAGRGATIRPVLENASSVGRAAGVAVPALVPTYVTHLLALGLAELGPEDGSLEDEYQILLTDSGVKAAHEEAAEAGWRAPRIVRRTLRISLFGRELWAACQPSQDQE